MFSFVLRLMALCAGLTLSTRGAVCKRGRLRELLSLFLHSVLGYY